MKAQSHQIWTRPTEVGFSIGDQIEGTSTTTTLFGVLRVSGDPVSNTPTIPMLGSTAGMSSNAKFAAATAVEAAGGDGIYIIYVEEEALRTGFTITKKSYIRGKVLNLESYGPVDIERLTPAKESSSPVSTSSSKGLLDLLPFK